MPHFTVAHVLVAGKTHRSSVSFEEDVRIFFQESVEGRGVSEMHGVAFIVGSHANSIEDHHHHRALRLFEAL